MLKSGCHGHASSSADSKRHSLECCLGQAGRILETRRHCVADDSDGGDADCWVLRRSSPDADVTTRTLSPSSNALLGFLMMRSLAESPASTSIIWFVSLLIVIRLKWTRSSSVTTA